MRPPALLDRAEYEHRAAAFRQTTTRRMWVMFAAMGVVLAFALFGFPMLRRVMQFSRTAGTLVAALPLVAVIGSQLWFTRDGLRRLRAAGLSCPDCDKPLVGEGEAIVVKSGRCAHCGEPALASAA